MIHDVSATADEVYRYWGHLHKGDGVGADKLQYVLHAEGRARYTSATNLFTYDYFVKDHLGNVRSIVTGNVTNIASGGGGTTAVSLLRTYLATHEISLGALEGAIFMNLANVRFNKPIAVTSTDVKAARLNASHPDRRVGTAIMLKVMAGDRFDLSAKSFWVGNPCAPTTSSSNMASAMLGVLTGAQSSLGMAEGTGAQLVTDAISPGNYAIYQSILNTLSNPFAPRAYINYMVFDEKMNLLPLESGAIQVSAIQGSWRNMTLALPLRIQKNGYLAVSVSNASNTDVFIDNVKIDVYQGTLIQEQHYYPFGLAINEGESATIVKNKFKYQGKEITDMLGAKDLQLYDFGPRQYDPQIGRFWGVDPMNQFPSGYTGMGNDPANMIDPSGCYAGGIGVMAPAPASPPGSYGGSQRAKENTFPLYFFVGSELPTFNLSVNLNAIGAFGYGVPASNDDGFHHNSVEEMNNRYDGHLIPDKYKWISEDGYRNIYDAATNSVFWDDFESNDDGGGIMDAVHTSLDVVGLIPGLGEAADGLNALIYAGQGDYVNAGLSAAAMIPLAGGAVTVGKFAKKGVNAFRKGGRLGNAATRSQIANIATTLQSRGYTIAGGGGRAAEEFLKPLGGGRRGGSYIDITAVHPNYPTLRINTVDVLTDGITPTARELRNATRIRTQIGPGEHLLLIPKR